LAQQAQTPSDGVNFYFLATTVATQRVLPTALEPELADLIAHPVGGQAREVTRGHLAHITEQMSTQRAVNIMSTRVHLQADTRKLELMGFQRNHLLPSETLLDRHRLELGSALVLGIFEFLGDAVTAQQRLEAIDSRGEVG